MSIVRGSSSVLYIKAHSLAMVVSNDTRCVKIEQKRKMYAQRRQSGARAVQYEAGKNKINDVRKTWYQQNKGQSDWTITAQRQDAGKTAVCYT